MSHPGDDPSGLDVPQPVLPADPSIDGGERVTDDEAETSRAGLLRSSAIVGVGTGLSRLTGLLRVLAMFYALQFTSLTDAYNAANTAPNTIYELLLGGVLSATLIPVFVDARHRGDDEAVDAVVTMITIVLVVVTLVAIVFAPWIFRIYTDKQSLISVGVPFLRMFAPQVLFYGLTAVATALLNSRKRFAAPAFAPILNNLVLIAILLQVHHLAGGVPTIEQVTNDTTLLLLLGFGTTAGIVAMTVVLWPAMRRAGIRLHARFDWHNPAIRTVARLSGWTFGYVIANQVALVLVQRLAIHSGVGNLSAYTFAFIFFQLPHGLLAVSLMTTYLPDLSALANRNDMVGFRTRFMEGTRVLVLLVVPAAVGLALLAHPLMDGLLGVLGQARNTATEAGTTADILRMFAIGLPGFSVYLFTLRGFYALKDTRTPFLVNLAENGTNVAFAYALVGGLSVTGLGLAYSIAYLVGAALALFLLSRKAGRLWSPQAAASIGRTLVAATAMGLVVWGLVAAVGPVSGWSAVALSTVAAVVGLGVYFGALVLLRSEDVGGLTRRLRLRWPTPTAG
ncbi:MAG: murein biosynthesis integral membrane protein MurJ [Acidimicrobiales bacterium]